MKAKEIIKLYISDLETKVSQSPARDNRIKMLKTLNYSLQSNTEQEGEKCDVKVCDFLTENKTCNYPQKFKIRNCYHKTKQSNKGAEEMPSVYISFEIHCPNCNTNYKSDKIHTCYE